MTRDDLFKVGCHHPAADLLECLPLCLRTCPVSVEKAAHPLQQQAWCMCNMPSLPREWAAPLGKAVQPHWIDPLALPVVQINASIVKTLITACGKHCPDVRAVPCLPACADFHC